MSVIDVPLHATLARNLAHDIPSMAPSVETDASPDAGLGFHICQTLQDVTDAWSVLYRVYLRTGFVAPNPFELHTTHHALGRHTAVIQSRIGQIAVGTISAINDSPALLPLDSVYPNELAALRSQGCKLIEVGLFGDRREGMERSFNTVLELMRYTFYFGQYSGATDFVCGIPPRRAKLYAHAFGFDIIGDLKSYETVQGNPVVLLRSNTAKAVANRNRHRAIDFFLRNPFDTTAFDSRFSFTPDEMAGSLLEQYAGTLSH